MTPVRSIKNQYRGINAHLHSALQSESGWGGFHTRHIVHLADNLNLQLRTLGYIATVEGSKPYRAAAIYELTPDQAQRGEPVVWIELLSPTNKGNSEDANAYRAKRMGLIHSGLVFVEIDYLHETPPTFPRIQPYNPERRLPRQPDAHPYWIAVLDPRPQVNDGEAQIIAMDVDEPLPTVEIPLKVREVLLFDFGKPYRKTFEEGFLGDSVDYRQFPTNFDHYSEADQTRIARRMLAVLETSQQGINLETGPFPVKDLSLEAALKQIEALS